LARTPLASILQKAYAAAHAEMEKPAGTGQVDILDNHLPGMSPVYLKEKNPVPNSKGKENSCPKIVIIGAGLAGLTCAYRLKQAGIPSIIYEATGRPGGRCWTKRGVFREGQMIERGGELIDSCHKEIQELAKELGLELDDLIEGEDIGTQPFYFIDGHPYTFKEATKDFLQVYPKLQRDLREAGETTLYNQYTKRGFELDHMSIVEYINEVVPGGIHSRFGKLLAIAYTIENGAEACKQSSLNLLYSLGFSQKGAFQIFGDSDERFHIKGGNDQLPALLAKELSGQINYHSELIKIEQDNQGVIKLIFRNDEKEWRVLADKVIITIPFRILKTIDYSSAKFRPLKRIAIEELGMGVNTKHHMQFFERFWRNIGNNGETFSDTEYQNTFEVTRGQTGTSGILVDYTGGDMAAKRFAVTKKKLKEMTKNFLDRLESVLPGSVYLLLIIG